MTTVFLHLTDSEAADLAKVLRLADGAEMIMFKRRRIIETLTWSEEDRLRRVVRVMRDQLRRGGHGR